MFNCLQINVGNIGEIYKIRVGHDNSGDFPAWYCNDVRMKDVHTNEELTFTCRKWMSRDEDDGEICREMPAQRESEPESQLLPGNYGDITTTCLKTIYSTDYTN